MKGWRSVEPGISTDGTVFAVRVYRQEGDRRVESSPKFATIEEAREFWAVWKTRRRFEKAGVALPDRLRPRQTLGTILDAYLEENEALGRDVDTLRGQRGVAKTIVRALGAARPVPLEREDLVDFAKWARLHTRTRGDLIARAFVLIRSAHKRKGLTLPVAPEVRFERGRRWKPPSPETVERFVDALTWGSPERTAAELMLFTGARLEEVLRVTAGDVDLERGRLALVIEKGPRGNRRTRVEVEIDAELRRVLEAVIPPGAPADLPLMLVRGRPLRTAGPLRKRLLAASRRAGIEPPISSLAWIRNFVLEDLAGRESMRTAQDAAGHASETTTATFYAAAVRDRLTRERRLEAGRALAGMRRDLRALPRISPAFPPQSEPKRPQDGPEGETAAPPRIDGSRPDSVN